MPRKAKPTAPASPSPEQVKRAAGLRTFIKDLSEGVRPPDAPPKTPREMTDEAAIKRWEASKKKRT